MSCGLLLLLNSTKSLSHSFRTIGCSIPKACHFKLLRTQKIFDCAATRACNNAAFQEPILEEYLINELPCSVETANEILANHPKIRETSRSDVAEATRVLKSAKVPTECFLRYPWLLTLSPKDLESKLDLLKSVNAISSTTIPLVRHDSPKLKKFLKNFPHNNTPSLPERIDCLCRCLETEPEELSDRLIVHPNLLTKDVQKLQNIVDLLKEANVPRYLLSSDLWLFYSTDKKIAERLSYIQKCNTLNVAVKPWLLRAGKNALRVWLKKRNRKVEVFGCNRDNKDYLADRLQCTHKFVKIIMTYKNSNLPNMNPHKLKEVIDFLFEKGYTAEDIRDNPFIFNMSLGTTKKRILEIENLGFNRIPLKLLQQSSKRYASSVEKLLENVPSKVVARHKKSH